jgi:hypothetical protein
LKNQETLEGIAALMQSFFIAFGGTFFLLDPVTGLKNKSKIPKKILTVIFTVNYLLLNNPVGLAL